MEETNMFNSFRSYIIINVGYANMKKIILSADIKSDE